MSKTILSGKSPLSLSAVIKFQFIQAFVLMALFGGVYLTCMIGLLPDKQQETYERFFAMVSAYLDTNDLPNNFEGHFFMTDFERNIRSSFNLFWPSVRLLGCYFHFSQVDISDVNRILVLT